MGASLHEEIIKTIDEAGVPYEHLTHDHVHTAEEAARVRGTKLEQAAKAIILKDKEGNYSQFIVAGNRKLDLKRIKKYILHVKNVSLASPEEVLARTGCTVGSVPPFGKLLELPTYIDTRLVATQKEIVFSAGTHHDSIKMKTKDFLELTKPWIEDYSRGA